LGAQEHELLVLFGREQRLAVEVDRPDLGVDQPLVALSRDVDVVLGPQSGELLAAAQQGTDQILDVRVPGTTGGGGAQRRDPEATVLVVVVDGIARPSVRVGEPSPCDARLAPAVRGLVAEQGLGGDPARVGGR
jgi:hypothetical protein